MDAQPPEYVATPDRRQVRILHVDDDPSLCEVTAEMLAHESEQFTVYTERSPADALDRLATADIDCIVSDYDMPVMNGIEFLRAVREEYPELPFILFTGKGTEDVASEAFSAGATDYFQKETGTDQYAVLANRIQTVVENFHARTQQQRQLDAIENAREGISILNDDGEFIYLNHAYAELYGYEREEMIGEHWEVIYPDDEVSFAREEILGTVQDQGFWSGRTVGLRADGRTFPEDHAVAATEDGGLICSVRDISEQQQRQEEFARYQTLVETLTDPVYVLDEKGQFVYVNDAFVEMTGYCRDRILEAGPELIKDPQAVQQGRNQLARILSSEGPESAHFEIEIQPKDGEPIPCEDHMGVLPYQGDSFNGSVGLLRDLSAKKQQEQTVRRYRRLLESLNDPVYALDQDGYVTYVNEAFTATFGYSQTEILGEHISLVVPDEDIERSEQLISELLTTDDKTTAGWEVSATTKDGEELTIENRLSILTDEEGTFEGSVAVARDSTSEKAETERLKRQNERLEEFASLVSHDLRNPLSVIGSRLALVQQEYESEHLDAIEQSVDRMDALIDDMLRLARSGKMIDEQEPVSLRDCAEECWGALSTEAATLRVDTDQTITADRARLQQLLENLLRNAVEHGGQDVNITIGGLPGGFYIADDGPGIPVGEREAVFEYGHSTVEDGTGYGLAIVQAVAEAHDWTITVTESAEGGTRFELTGVSREH